MKKATTKSTHKRDKRCERCALCLKRQDRTITKEWATRWRKFSDKWYCPLCKKTGYDLFIEYRRALEEKGHVLCEHAGGEECNKTALFFHHTHDADNHTIPVCGDHRCKTCVPINGVAKMQERLKKLKQPLHTAFLEKFTDDCERDAHRPDSLASVDIALYGIIKEILTLRRALQEVCSSFERDSHLMQHARQYFGNSGLRDLKAKAWRYDK
jgi:hypothetical protein